MNNRDQILKELKNQLRERFGDDIRKVILFGSQISNEPKNDSDFDILIVLAKKPDWQYRKLISNCCYEIDLKYNIVTDTHILSESELKTLRGKQPVFLNAVRKGIYA
jgi:predicted nucleotidyltransferase